MNAIPGRRAEYIFPLSTDTGADGSPSRHRRKPPTPPPAVDPPRWDGAACEGQPTELWFSDHPEDTDLARRICTRCPHTGGAGTCATFARQATNPRILHGIWGGVDMAVVSNRVKPLMCTGPGCDKAATGRRKYCSDRCYYAACRARKKAREAAAAARKLAEWETKVAGWRREQLDNAAGARAVYNAVDIAAFPVDRAGDPGPP